MDAGIHVPQSDGEARIARRRHEHGHRARALRLLGFRGIITTHTTAIQQDNLASEGGVQGK